MEGEYATRSWHIEHQVHIVGDRGKFCQGRALENGMVASLKVGDLKLDVLSPVVGVCPKGNTQNLLIEGYCCVAWDHSVEGGLQGSEHVGDVQTHLL